MKKKEYTVPECLENASGAGIAYQPLLCTTSNLWARESPSDISTGGRHGCSALANAVRLWRENEEKYEYEINNEQL